MKVVTLANQKGGVGKSTIAVTVGCRFQDLEFRTCILDLDPQASCMTLLDASEKHHDADYLPEIAQCPDDITEQGISKLIKSIQDSFDICIIDTPGRQADIVNAAYKVSDLIILPVTPSPFDLKALRLSVKTTKQAQKDNPALKLRTFINRSHPRRAMSKEVRLALKKYKIDTFKASYGDRAAFVKCIVNGQSLTSEYGVDKAATECRALVKEIKEVLGDA